MTKVEKVVSLVDSTPRHDSMAQDFTPPTFQQTLNDQGMMDMVKYC